MRRSLHRQLILTVVVVGAASAMLLAQKRVHSGRELDSNTQLYNMRSEAGHALDHNLRLGSGGYNSAAVGVTRRLYSVDRSNFGFYRNSANITRRQYSIPYASDAYYNALVRSGRNPRSNPSARAYRNPPVYNRPINTRIEP